MHCGRVPVGLRPEGLSVDLPCSADGQVSFEMLPRRRSVCQELKGTHLPGRFVVGRPGDLG